MRLNAFRCCIAHTKKRKFNLNFLVTVSQQVFSARVLLHIAQRKEKPLFEANLGTRNDKYEISMMT